MNFDFSSAGATIQSAFLYGGVFALIEYYGRIIGGFLSFIFLAGIIITIVKMSESKRAKIFAVTARDAEKALHAEQAYRTKSMKVWSDIVEKANSDNPSNWLSAVIQADAVFDDILKRMGIHGETMGERLQKLDQSKLASLQSIWDAHKLRNRIAHTSSTMLRKDELLDAIEKYKKGLRELGYLE
ncbi:MAG: hypothetical protein AAB950_00450 [Patescibacteria group bacterium]